MIETIISSKTRIKLLIKFFLNSETSSYLRNLASEFGESSNAIRVELNKFEKSGLLVSNNEGNRKYFRANTAHPLFSDLNNIIRKHLGIDRIIEQVVSRIGQPESVYLTGTFADGSDGPFIDLVFIGSDIDTVYLSKLCEKAGKKVNKLIRHSIIPDKPAFDKLCEEYGGKYLLLWKK